MDDNPLYLVSDNSSNYKVDSDSETSDDYMINKKMEDDFYHSKNMEIGETIEPKYEEVQYPSKRNVEVVEDEEHYQNDTAGLHMEAMDNLEINCEIEEYDLLKGEKER